MNIDRFADPMIAGTIECDARSPRPANRMRKAFSGREYDREMIKAGGAARRGFPAQTMPCVKRDVMMIAPGRKKSGASAPILRHVKFQHLAIELYRVFQIGNAQMNVANPHLLGRC